MKISKTAFKEYSRCPRVYSLEKIYYREASIFNNDENERVYEILQNMFDDEDGEDLLVKEDPQLEAMLPYYSEVERWALIYASHQFGIEIPFFSKTKNQKCFRFFEDGHEFYTFLDGYAEKDDKAIIIEVKATTSKKFAQLGPKIKSKINPLFECKNNIYHLKKDLTSNYQRFYEKLFDRYSNVGRYIYDIAVERYFIEKSIEKNQDFKRKKFRYYLAVLNSDYCFSGQYINEQPDYSPDLENNLIRFIDVTEITLECLPKIEKIKNDILKSLSVRSIPNAVFGRFCEFSSSSRCLFNKVCFPELFKKGAITEYFYSTSFTDGNGLKHSRFDLVNAGKTSYDDIPELWLKDNQKIQRLCLQEKNEYVNKIKIEAGLEGIKYPIYHLDFESFPCPLPRFVGEAPYSQSLFQFSVHIEKEPGNCDEIKDHYSFLAESFGDHREELVQKLIEIIDLKKGGTILVYNKSFEYQRLKELSKLFPKYRKELENMLEHIFDLMDIVKTKTKYYQELGFSEEESKLVNYYHYNLQGLYSIKKVLPLFSNLSYETLNVKKGSEAIATYAKFKYLPKEDIEIVRNDLIDYCRQDTWAMVLILKGIREKLEKKAY